MVSVDSMIISPNPVDTGKTLKIEIVIHEEYEKAKKYINSYPYRYGDMKK